MLAPIQDMQAMPEGAPVDRPAVELLHRNALRLQKLVNTLLEFSRIEAGRIEAVYELVRLHGGAMHVASRLGSGTTFEVRIPRGSLHLSQDRLRPARTLPSSPLGAEPFVAEASRWVSAGSTLAQPSERAVESNTRILIADDNADMRDYLARLLGERWAIESVGDGAAALASVRRSPPALLLCDVMMPDLDGFALAQAIRADAALSALPIIMLSARAGEEESSKGLSAGANDYIAKPFAARDLLMRVASVLAAARSAKERQALEESQRRNLQRLFEHAPVAIGVVRGPEHVFEVANPLYRALVPGHQPRTSSSPSSGTSCETRSRPSPPRCSS